MNFILLSLALFGYIDTFPGWVGRAKLRLKPISAQLKLKLDLWGKEVFLHHPSELQEFGLGIPYVTVTVQYWVLSNILSGLGPNHF